MYGIKIMRENLSDMRENLSDDSSVYNVELSDADTGESIMFHPVDESAAWKLAEKLRDSIVRAMGGNPPVIYSNY
jgi:hypothetical protein